MRNKLMSLKKPFFHLVVCENTDFNKFASSCKDEFSDIVKIIHGELCKTSEGLFNEFASVFRFPSYFGNNWTAFDECLNDLDWLSCEKYLLLICEAEKILSIEESNFQTFISILSQTVDEWTNGRCTDDFPTPPTPFHVIFHCSKGMEKEFKAKLNETGLIELEIYSNVFNNLS